MSYQAITIVHKKPHLISFHPMFFMWTPIIVNVRE
jgi:hypothetical protein